MSDNSEEDIPVDGPMPAGGPDITDWANRYVLRQESAMRGGQRLRTRKRIKQDIAQAFPGSGVMYMLWLAWWAWKIWRRLKTQ